MTLCRASHQRRRRLEAAGWRAAPLPRNLPRQGPWQPERVRVVRDHQGDDQGDQAGS